jgi:peroxiredoxin
MMARSAARSLKRRTPMAALQPGAPAPDFSLATHNGEKAALSAYKGRRTVVTFLPFAFTGG